MGPDDDEAHWKPGGLGRRRQGESLEQPSPSQRTPYLQITFEAQARVCEWTEEIIPLRRCAHHKLMTDRRGIKKLQNTLADI